MRYCEGFLAPIDTIVAKVAFEAPEGAGAGGRIASKRIEKQVEINGHKT
jgi:hypothetical protein